MRALLRLTRTLKSSKRSELKLSSASVQAVSFDAMDTIITMNEPFSEVYSRVAGDCGFSVNPSKVATSFPEYFKSLSDSHPCFGFRSIGHFEWWKRVVQGCLDEFKTVAADLRDRGLGVAVVSNFDARLSGILRGLDLLPLFDLVVTSGEVGVEKPNPVIFERVVRHYKLSGASRLLHVGDHLLRDYEAAKDFGASAILFDPSSKHGDCIAVNRITSFAELKVN